MINLQDVKGIVLIILAAGVAAGLVVGIATGNVTYEQIRITLEMVLGGLLGSGAAFVYALRKAA